MSYTQGYLHPSPNLGYLRHTVGLQSRAGQLLQEGAGDRGYEVEVVALIELRVAVLTDSGHILCSWHHKVDGNCIRYLFPGRVYQATEEAEFRI